MKLRERDEQNLKQYRRKNRSEQEDVKNYVDARLINVLKLAS